MDLWDFEILQQIIHMVWDISLTEHELFGGSFNSSTYIMTWSHPLWLHRVNLIYLCAYVLHHDPLARGRTQSPHHWSHSHGAVQKSVKTDKVNTSISQMYT